MNNTYKNLENEGLISIRKHNNADLWILNYTPKCQLAKAWDENTLQCRGLIIDCNDKIVARPFRKFFNLGEADESLAIGTPEVYEKMDGSLGIIYWIDDVPYVATRGSFHSEQSSKANEILKKYDTSLLDKSKTYLVEIIYPENKIVVDYKEEELYLLAVIDIATGKEYSLDKIKSPFPKVKKYNISLGEMAIPRENAEGYVLRYPNGFRVKYKFDEYKRLHSLLTNISARKIWQMLKDKENISVLLDNVPDEFFTFVKEQIKNINNRYNSIIEEAQNCLPLLEGKVRKEQAMLVLKNYKHISKVIFGLLDKRDVSNLVWDMVYPEHEIPYKNIF